MTWLPTFACDRCGVPTRASGSGMPTCPRCHAGIACRDAIYRALGGDQEASMAPFVAQYRRIRARDGYRGQEADYYRALPQVSPCDPQAHIWHIRQRSYARLCRLLARSFPQSRLRIADLGAGNGWLSHRLAANGHHPVAVDVLVDDEDGLGVCPCYQADFVCVQADFTRLPFAPDQFDVAIFNGSLHYAPNPATALQAAARLLAPGGAVVVMDSPMFTSDLDGLAMVGRQDEHFRREFGLARVLRPGAGYLTFQNLSAAVAPLGLATRFHRTRGDVRWETQRIWARARLGLPPAQFGVWVARW